MNVVGRFSSFITQGMSSVATPFHPFGGAVDIIVVKQHDGTYRSTPWYVRFGKFQGVLKGAEKVVQIEVNGVEANFHMYLDNSGEAYFVKEVDPVKDDDEDLKDSDNLDSRRDDTSTTYSDIDCVINENDFVGPEGDEFNESEVEVRDERFTLGMDRLERVESDGHIFYEFQDELEGSLEFPEYGPSRYDNLESVEEHPLESQDSSSEVILVSVDGHILTAPISKAETNGGSAQLSPRVETEEDNRGDTTSEVNIQNLCEPNSLETLDSTNKEKELPVESISGSSLKRGEVFKSCLELSELALKSTNSSSIEILEATEDPEKELEKPLKNDETEEKDLEISNNDDGLSNDETEEKNLEISNDDDGLSQVESATPEGCIPGINRDGSDSMPVHVVSHHQESDKQSDVEILASEDEYSKNEHVGDIKSDLLTKLEISLCGDLLHVGMGLKAAEEAFEANRISPDEFKLFDTSMLKNEKNLIVRLQGKYLPWDKVADMILGVTDSGQELLIEPDYVIPVEEEEITPLEKEGDSGIMASTPSRRWGLWPIRFRRANTLERGNSSKEEALVDSSSSVGPPAQPAITALVGRASLDSPRKQIIRTNVPSTDQIASLNLKEGQNTVNFVFSTRVLGSQTVEAHIYLWKWNTRIVISDVDGTITKSDVLGQFMPLVGKDWTHTGIARLLSAIKENGYQLLYLSARAIVQAYLTKSFLFNLKQDGKSIPSGPVVISPDGLFPSLYREVIRRAPHEFKIACLEDIKALFPPDHNPFYAGFGNRDTDELSYRKMGIAKGKIFIINPKGEVAINHRIDVKSYTSLHTLVDDMFPPSMVEQEDYNSWNYWKMPLLDVEDL